MHKSQYYEFLSDSPYAILVVDTYEKGPSKEAASSDEVVTVSGPRQVEGQERIVVEHEGDKSKTFTQMVALLPPGECRFAVAIRGDAGGLQTLTRRAADLAFDQ